MAKTALISCYLVTMLGEVPWTLMVDGQWRIGDGSAHFGYQNPLAAYALVHEPSMRPKGSSAVEDWQKSLERQIEFYGYLQTAEGAFAGRCHQHC